MNEERTRLYNKILPGNSAVLSLYVVPPGQGDFRLQISLIQEKVAWFHLQDLSIDREQFQHYFAAAGYKDQYGGYCVNNRIEKYQQ